MAVIGSKALSNPLDSTWEADSDLPCTPPPLIVMQPQDDFEKKASPDQKMHRTEEIVLDSESSILVEISDALSEKEKVKYTIRSITKLPDWKETFSVVRDHEEFMWLHHTLEETEAYAAFIIPPSPPKTNFEVCQQKLLKIASDENNMTKEEFIRNKQDLEQEYLALFKKTVAMHEVFLQRLAAHPVIRRDQNFKLFLQYENEFNVRQKNTREVVGSFWKKVTASADHLVLNGHKDVDYTFELQRSYIVEYSHHISQASELAEKIVRLRKSELSTNCSSFYLSLYSQLDFMSRTTSDNMRYLNPAVADTFDMMRKIEMKSANDEELKLSDTLTYFSRDTQAVRDLFYRRLRCLGNYENANRSLDKARAKNSNIIKCEQEQVAAMKTFERFSEVAKSEILAYKRRRVASFAKNINKLIELEIINEKAQVQMLQGCLDRLKQVL